MLRKISFKKTSIKNSANFSGSLDEDSLRRHGIIPEGAEVKVRAVQDGGQF